MTDDLTLSVSVEPLAGADDWITAVAKRAHTTDADVRAVLAQQQIRPPAGWGARHRLRVQGMYFAGVKTPSEGPREPYIFHAEFRNGVTGLGTHGENDAGKSSVIRTVRWALRGRCELQGDVRQWMRAVLVVFEIDTEQLVVAFGVNDSDPCGSVFLIAESVPYAEICERTAAPVQALAEPDEDRDPSSNDVFAAVLDVLVAHGAIELATFASASDFERVVGSIMLDRLGFERLPSWQARPQSAQAHDADGVLGELGWPAWSAALAITDPKIPVVIGEEPLAASRLLQMYLGSPWAATVATCTARKGQLASLVGAARRRIEDHRRAAQGGISVLRARVTAIDEELRRHGSPVDLADIDRRVRDVVDAANRAAQAETQFLDAARAYGDTNRLFEDAESDVAALMEAKLTRRFWHALKPTCCPRCDTQVDQQRWARERDGQCSLCSSPLQLDADVPADGVQADLEPDGEALADLLAAGDVDADTLDELTLARLQVLQLKRRLAQDDAAMEQARLNRQAAQDQLARTQDAATMPKPAALARLQDLREERAGLIVRIEERQGAQVGDVQATVDELERQRAVVVAAEYEAKQRRDSDQATLLQQVNEQVTALGKKLGIRQLTKATLNGAAHVPVIKGGPRENFGSLTDGEKLRLKIAVVVALLRVGGQAGVTRHPGLILIDSLGKEEVNPRNMVDMLTELSSLAEEVPHLQVILTSAHGEVLVEGLGAERVRLAEIGKPLW